MTIVPALLLTVLCAGAGPALTQGSEPSAVGPATELQQGRSGLIIAADIEGRLAICDQATNRRPATGESPAGYPAPPPHHSRALDPRHRIELRLGGWGSGWHDYHDDWHDSGSAQAAFGLEYLNFIRSDLGVGIGLSSLVRDRGDWEGLVDAGTARVTASIPVVVRWYPVRRMTRTRSVEPYVTAGIGPVFGVDGVYTDDHDSHDWSHDEVGNARVGTTIGGRLGGGVDVRLGSVFTLGVAGAWNWDAGFSDDLWRGPRPGGGEFTLVLGWHFGR